MCSIQWRTISYFESLNSYFESLNSYFESLNSYFESLNSYFESLNSYFESLNSYFESLNSYFQSLNSYFQSLNSYFQSLNSYFETVKHIKLLSHYSNISNNEFDIPSIIFERFAYLKPTPKAYMLKISPAPPPPPPQYFAKCPPLVLLPCKNHIIIHVVALPMAFLILKP